LREPVARVAYLAVDLMGLRVEEMNNSKRLPELAGIGI